MTTENDRPATTPTPLDQTPETRLTPPRLRVRTPLSIQAQTTSILVGPQLRNPALHNGLNWPGAAAKTTPAQASLPAENNPINDRLGRGAHVNAKQRRRSCRLS